MSSNDALISYLIPSHKLFNGRVAEGSVQRNEEMMERFRVHVHNIITLKLDQDSLWSSVTFLPLLCPQATLHFNVGMFPISF